MKGGAWGGCLLITVFSACGLVLGADVFPHTGHDPSRYDVATYMWVIWLSVWGATVAYLQKVKNRPAAFSLWVLAIEWLTAPACGVLAFWAGEAANADRLITASGVFIAGFAGKKFVSAAEKRLSGSAE